MVSLRVMRKFDEDLKVSELQISLLDFLISYNQNIPTSFPQASVALLQKFKDTHSMLFTKSDLWSLDRHRKKVMDWIPANSATV